MQEMPTAGFEPVFCGCARSAVTTGSGSDWFSGMRTDRSRYILRSILETCRMNPLGLILVAAGIFSICGVLRF